MCTTKIIRKILHLFSYLLRIIVERLKNRDKELSQDIIKEEGQINRYAKNSDISKSKEFNKIIRREEF